MKILVGQSMGKSTNIPNVKDYVSDRVFDGIRYLTPEQAKELKESIKRSKDFLEKNQG